MGKMGREALGPRIGKCHKENVSYFIEEWERAQIGENGPGSLAAPDDFNKDLEKPWIVETGRRRAPRISTNEILKNHSEVIFCRSTQTTAERG